LSVNKSGHLAIPAIFGYPKPVKTQNIRNFCITIIGYCGNFVADGTGSFDKKIKKGRGD
jgi:hypothetical protein